MCVFATRQLPQAVWGGGGEARTGHAAVPQQNADGVHHTTQGLPGSGHQECSGEEGREREREREKERVREREKESE